MNKYLVFIKVEKSIEYLTGKSYDFEGSFTSDSETVVLSSDVFIKLSLEEVLDHYSNLYHCQKDKTSGRLDRNIVDLTEFLASDYQEFELGEDQGCEQLTFKVIKI